MSPRTFYKRLERGYSVERAHLMPKSMPTWMWLVEQEEGEKVVDVFKRLRGFGMSIRDVERSFEIGKGTLKPWIRKWKAEGLLC